MLFSIIIKLFSFPLLSESLWCPESRWGKLLVEVKAPPGAGRGNGERAQERLLAPVPHPCVPVPAVAPLRAPGAVGGTQGLSPAPRWGTARCTGLQRSSQNGFVEHAFSGPCNTRKPHASAAWLSPKLLLQSAEDTSESWAYSKRQFS